MGRQEQPLSPKLEAPPDFDGPTDNRRCTDVLFSILICAMWVAMTAVGIYAVQRGDYRVVVHPMDYDGNICGTDYGNVDMTEYSKFIYINNYGGGVCVKECPKVANLTDVGTLVTYNGVYQGLNAYLPADFLSVADYSNSEHVKVCDTTNCNTDPQFSWLSPGILAGNSYAFYAVDTFEVLGTRCLSNPNALLKINDEVYIPDLNPINMESLSSAQDFFTNLYGDIYTARYYVLGFGLGASLILGFLYAQLLRFPGLMATIIWTSIFCTIGIIFATGAYAYTTAKQWESDDPQVYSDSTIQGTKIFSYVAFGIGVCVVFITLFLRRSIQLAMSCVKAAARCVGAMPLMIVYPIIQCLFFFAFLAIWTFYAVHLASIGDMTTYSVPMNTEVKIRRFEFSPFVERCGWYLLFCFFWTSAFIVAMGELVIALCVAKWYFTRDKSRIGSGIVIKSMCTSMFYHMGTAAFGSLFVAIVQMIRAIVARIQKKAAELDNKVGEALLCCCQCCLWCFQKFLEFLNKNAYIQTAIFGTNFCRSAREAFALIVRNAGRVASIHFVSEVVLFVGKIFISCMTTGIAYILMEKYISLELYSLAGPCVMVLFMSFFIADMFLDIFEMSTSTILQCFIADEEMFNGPECYADGELREWLDDYEKSERNLKVT